MAVMSRPDSENRRFRSVPRRPLVIRDELSALIRGLRRGRLIASRLKRLTRGLRNAVTSETSRRAFLACGLGGAALAIVTRTPPFLSVLCMIAWPLAFTVIFLLELVLGVKQRRIWDVIGSLFGLALIFFFPIIGVHALIRMVQMMLAQ